MLTQIEPAMQNEVKADRIGIFIPAGIKWECRGWALNKNPVFFSKDRVFVYLFNTHIIAIIKTGNKKQGLLLTW